MKQNDVIFFFYFETVLTDLLMMILIKLKVKIKYEIKWFDILVSPQTCLSVSY